jgi:Lipocalin-like domain
MLLRPLALGMLVATLSVTASAQTKGKSPVEGVWKVAELQVIGGQNPRTISSPQPGLYIFTSGHYSIMIINADKPRTAIPFQAAPATDKDKIALYDHWAPFTANSGTYTIQGSTLTTKPLVAKNEGVMQGQGQTREFKIEGNTLWLIAKPAAGQPGAETRTKLTRVE